MMPTVPFTGRLPDWSFTEVKSGIVTAGLATVGFADAGFAPEALPFLQPVKTPAISVNAIAAHAIFLINLFILSSPFEASMPYIQACCEKCCSRTNATFRARHLYKKYQKKHYLWGYI